MEYIELRKYIRKRGSKWVVLSEAGKVLGTHPSRAAAARQLRAVEANKHRSMSKGEEGGEGLEGFEGALEPKDPGVVRGQMYDRHDPHTIDSTLSKRGYSSHTSEYGHKYYVRPGADPNDTRNRIYPGIQEHDYNKRGSEHIGRKVHHAEVLMDALKRHETRGSKRKLSDLKDKLGTAKHDIIHHSGDWRQSSTDRPFEEARNKFMEKPAEHPARQLHDKLDRAWSEAYKLHSDMKNPGPMARPRYGSEAGTQPSHHTRREPGATPGEQERRSRPFQDPTTQPRRDIHADEPYQPPQPEGEGKPAKQKDPNNTHPQDGRWWETHPKHGKNTNEIFKSFEDASQGLDHEEATWIDSSGKEHGLPAGERNSMTLTREQIAAMTVHEASLSHNHPSADGHGGHGGSFSEADIAFAMENGLSEIRAHDKWYVHIARPESGTSFKKIPNIKMRKVIWNAGYSGAAHDAVERARAAGDFDKESVAAKMFNAVHEYWMSELPKYGVRYARVRKSEAYGK